MSKVHSYKRVAIGELLPANVNPRLHSTSQIEQLRRSIREFGFTNPLLIDERGQIIAGHGRLQAASLEGMQELPAIEVTGLTDAQKRALLIADNQLATTAEWDDALLAAELHALTAAEFDLSVLGFSESDLDALMLPSTSTVDPDAVPPVPKNPITLPGDVWQLGRHRLMCGDSTVGAQALWLLDGNKPHLMVTDPPYGVEYDADWRNHAMRKDGSPSDGRAIGKVENDDKADWTAAWALFPGDVAYVWHADRRASEVQVSLEAAAFEIRRQIIWAKQQFAIGRGHYHWQHEPCWYAVRKGKTAHWHGDRKQTTVWDIDKPVKSETGHSTQKPVECMQRPIENNSLAGEAVYDPFVGSGTTLIAAEITGRTCYAMELSPAYVDVVVQRWESFTGQKATRCVRPTTPS